MTDWQKATTRTKKEELRWSSKSEEPRLIQLKLKRVLAAEGLLIDALKLLYLLRCVTV